MKGVGSVVFPFEYHASATAAGTHLNNDLFLILFNMHGLKMAPQTGNKHLDLPGQLLGVLRHFFQIRQPPGFHAGHHDLFQHLVAKTLSHLAQRRGRPVPVQIVHPEEFIIHALRNLLGLLRLPGVNGFR